MKHFLILLLATLTVVWNNPAEAQGGVTKVGTTAAKFLSIPIGARALALGGAYTSIADDASAVYWNPGGLAQMNSRQIMFMHSEWLADINFDYLSLVFAGGSAGTFGLSVTAMTMGDFEVTTEAEPEGTGEIFSASSIAIGFTYARRITDRFMIGGTVKGVIEKIANSSAEGLAVDIGTLFTTPFYGVRLGTSISNFGTKMRMSGDDLLVTKDIDQNTNGNNADVNAFLATDEFDLPLNLKIGLSRDFSLNEQNRLTLAVDALYPNDNQQSMNVGLEYATFGERIFLRGGYKSLLRDESDEEYVLGAGLQQQLVGNLTIKLDYAFQSWAILENVHLFSIVLDF